MKIDFLKKGLPFFALLVLIVLLICNIINVNAQPNSERYLAGDFHTHTYLTDGKNTLDDVLKNAFGKFKLDWMANSEHGGSFSTDPYGNSLKAPMWRWLSLKTYSYPLVENFRKQYKNKLLIQGVEWNVPTHEHASVGIITDQPNSISNFEYIFDQNDNDTSKTDSVKVNKTHQDAIKAIKWLDENYKNKSYVVLNHPSRKLMYNISDIRDFNNAAPGVFLGIEGIPGHQKEINRGGYDGTYGGNTNKARTYGGADLMLAKVGGTWDALLGEGRKFWIFGNSDFHNTTNDFWPGEYTKSYTKVDYQSQGSLIKGMQSGNSFSVTGDLINNLGFTVKNGCTEAEMGQTIKVGKKANDITIKIKFKSPKLNNNGAKVKVDHVDLIAGEIKGKVQQNTPEYSNDSNVTTKVIATFDSKIFKVENGYNVITYKLKNLDKNMYFRIRGTNLKANVTGETDEKGNPLIDSSGVNNLNKAYSDLWFYSNPIFVETKL